MDFTFDEAKVLIHIEKILEDILKDTDYKIFFNTAPRRSTFPYSVFDLGNAFQGQDGKTTFNLNINIWNNKGNKLTEILEIQKLFQKKLHKSICKNQEHLLDFNLDSTNSIPEIDLQMRRRELTFSVNYYKKK